MKNKKTAATIIISMMSLIFITACSSYEKDDELYKRGYNPQVNKESSTYSHTSEDHNRTKADYTTTDYDRSTNYSSGVTAQDQGSSDWDVKTTQTIRQQIVNQEGFSTNAKNVKVITINGNVYLKGPVETILEKNRIESIAKDAAGMTKVNSEINVTR